MRYMGFTLNNLTMLGLVLAVVLASVYRCMPDTRREHAARIDWPGTLLLAAVILSTGMQTIETIRASVDILDKAGVEYALLECTNLYPSPPEIVSLQGVTDLRNAFPKAVVGFSDHSIGPEMALASVALVAVVVFFVRNASENMVKAGIASGFNFLWRDSGIEVPFNLTGYKPSDTVVDGPVAVGNWAPRNYTNKYAGRTTLLNAIAAPATSGFSSPAAARGIAATL